MKSAVNNTLRLAGQRASTCVLCLILAACYAVPPHVVGQKTEIQPEGLEEAWRLFGQVVELYDKGQYDAAIPLAERVLLTFEKTLGPNHPYVATALNHLGLLYQKKDDYARAEAAHRRALAIRENALVAGHPDIAQSLSNLALIYQEKGNYVQAESLYQRALAIVEKVFSPNHLVVATVLKNYAELYYLTGDYTRAEALCQRTLTIVEKELSPDDPWVATSLNQLAQLYQEKGDYARAEPLYLRSLAIRKKALGPEHIDVAQSFNNMGTLYATKGDYTQAELNYRSALAIVEKTLSPDHSLVAVTLNNLADLYMEMRDYVKAEALYQRSIAIAEKALGPYHPWVANALSSFGSLYRAKRDYARAEPLQERALAIREKALGLEHPAVASALNDIAILYHDKGDYARAEQLYQRALSIREKSLGPTHLVVAEQLNNLAALYTQKGDFTRAVQFLLHGNEVLEDNLARIISTGSERQKLAYLNKLSGNTYSTISLHTRSAPSDPEALQLALTTVLRRKGRALDAMSNQANSLRGRLDPQDRALLDQLSGIQSQLSALALGRSEKIPAAGYKELRSRLEGEVERLQDAIGRRSAEFRAQTRPVTIEQVQQALPPGATLAEFFTYQPLDLDAKIPSNQFRAPRYVVYVLRKEGKPLWADLGEAKGIDEDVSRLRMALRCPQTVDDIEECPSIPKVKGLARVVDERVMRPVRKLMGEARHIFVSPDGALNLLPFAALVDERDKYLVEDYSLTYLTSGRDLLRLQQSGESREPPLAIANPAFRTAGQVNTVIRKTELTLPNRSGDMVVDFSPLPETAAEARALSSVLPGLRLLTQTQASETALKQVHGPRLLHIATHGFFLPDQPDEPADATRGFKLAGAGVLPRTLTRSENPLLRSGLALAGANLTPREGVDDDGILTALEASGLDLWGTKLVVLSACETGIGAASYSEGIYGLRRALVLAGSESQVMSLWQVSDVATKDLMVGYYKRLMAGEGRTEALRKAQLEILHSGGREGDKTVPLLGSKMAKVKANYSHPYYWAAFIQSGDWRSISPQPGLSPR